MAPPVLAAMTLAMTAAGAVASASASQQSANYQAQVARNNAQIAGQNALTATEAGNERAYQQGARTRQMVGAERAAAAAGGLDPNAGSPLEVEESQRGAGYLDALTIRNNAARQAYGYQVQGESDQAQAGLDTMAGQNKAIGSILGGASSVAGKWSQFQTNGVNPVGFIGSGGGINAGVASDYGDIGIG